LTERSGCTGKIASGLSFRRRAKSKNFAKTKGIVTRGAPIGQHDAVGVGLQCSGTLERDKEDI
jgi:hypothetical protein